MYMLPHALVAMRAGDHPHGNSGSEATGLRSSDLPDRTLESGPMRSRIQLQVSNKVIILIIVIIITIIIIYYTMLDYTVLYYTIISILYYKKQLLPHL